MPEYYYYTKWEFPGDEHLEKGEYHTTWISQSTPTEFLSHCIQDQLLVYRRFKTKEEMDAFAATVGLK